MVQIIVFVPNDYKELLKDAMFKAGGGKIGNYDSCCFEQEGIGQFRPLENSNTFIGQVGEIEKVVETRIEMSCLKEKLADVIKAMKEAHPYETPAYYAIDTVRI